MDREDVMSDFTRYPSPTDDMIDRSYARRLMRASSKGYIRLSYFTTCSLRTFSSFIAASL